MDRSEMVKEQWAKLSEEEREAMKEKFKQGAKRMWSERTEKQRREVGRKIAEGRRQAALLRAKKGGRSVLKDEKVLGDAEGENRALESQKGGLDV